jgi:hypothetical protein
MLRDVRGSGPLPSMATFDGNRWRTKLMTHGVGFAKVYPQGCLFRGIVSITIAQPLIIAVEIKV